MKVPLVSGTWLRCCLTQARPDLFLFAMRRPANDILPQELAKLTIEAFIRDGMVIAPPAKPAGILAGRAGVFVTLRNSDGQLRGCIGSIVAERLNVAEEIIQNAISAATRDPRFPRVRTSDLSELTYSVDVLSTPEPIRGPEDLDPEVYGVIIATMDGLRRGLLLPRIPGLESVKQQWHAVHSKAGIKVGTPVKVERFMVLRFGGE